MIPKLINLEFSKKEIESEIADHGGIVAKAYLSAKETTVAKILDYSAETAESLISLMKDRAIVLDHNKAIEIYQSTIDTANNEKNRIITIMQELNLQGRKDAATFDYLNKSYDIQEGIVSKSMKSKEEQETLLKPLHLEFAKKCIAEHGRLLSLLPPMTIALRNELDNDGDSQVFIDALNDNIQKMNKAFDSIFAEN